MALPEKGHPLRPLHLAGRSFYVLGALLLIPISILLKTMIFTRSGVVSVFFLIALGMYVGMASLFFILGYQIQKHQSWAIITGKVFSTLLTLCSLFFIIGAGSTTAARLMSGNFQFINLAYPLIGSLFVLTFWVLTRQLDQGRKFLKTLKSQGFEVLPAGVVMPAPLAVLPIEPIDDASVMSVSDAQKSG